MRRILVPIDFSATSKKAFRFAVDIASKTDGAIILYHLFTPEKKIAFGSRKMIDENNKRTETNILKRMTRLRKKVLEETGGSIVISTVVGRTPVVNNILGFAEHNHIDMIVMGTQGADGLKKVTIGSVAAKIVANADVPVILIPEKFEMKQIEHVVFTTDIKKADRRAIPIVFDFAGLHEANITVVNMFLKLHEEDKKNQEEFETYIKRIQKTYNISNLLFEQMETANVAKSLENLSEEIKYDVLAMARRQLQPGDRLFQKSFTKNMAFMTTQPLLVVPEER